MAVPGVAHRELRGQVVRANCCMSFSEGELRLLFCCPRGGDRVIVKVLSVDNKDMSNIKIQVSVKQASINPYEFALKKYSVGNRYVGTVSMVDKNGVFVALDGGVDCLCRFPARGRPMKGANVTVQILGIDEKSNRIWGIITHSSMVL